MAVSKMYWLRLRKEKFIYKIFSSNSTLEISIESVEPITSVKVGLKRSMFRTVFGYEVLAEALDFKNAVDKLERYIYDSEEKEVTIPVVHMSGYMHVFKITKKRKNCSYSDYKRLAYLIRYVIVVSSTRKWERKLSKKMCHYYLRDRKEIEKYEEFCF